MLVPNTKPGFMFLADYGDYFQKMLLQPPLFAQACISETILHGVELLPISLSHNNYGMLENMS